MTMTHFLLITTLLCSCVGRAQDLRAEQAREVQAELEKFERNWPEKVPYASAFGIKRLADLMDLEYPGLEQFKALIDAKNYDGAEQALLGYYKNKYKGRTHPGKVFYGTEREDSENALLHYFRGNKDAHPPVYRGGKIDWKGRAFADGKEIHDKEWYYQFQRLTWWPALAKAYALSGDEKYFREWRYEMVDWARSNLPFTAETPYFIKRGMETYNRCERLTEVLPYMIQSENFDAKTLLFFLISFHEQSEHIRTVYFERGNHLLGQLSAVFLNGVNFPEFKLSTAWKNDALTRLPQMMIDEIYEDGMSRELVFSYHTMYTSLFAQAYDLFRQHGYEKVLPPEYYARLLKMAEIYAYQSFPDNTICQFGDAWKDRFPGLIFSKFLKPYAADIPYFDYMVSGGKEGTPPPKCSVAYPLSGFYFFRSEWSPDAVFMPIKCAAGGQWHSQIDNGTFELYAYGRNFMTDSGSYMYDSSSDEDKRWREWFRSTKAHQTLTLDHQDIQLESRHILWKESDGLVALVIENQSYPELKHRRTVLFVDNRYFLIYDEAIGSAVGDLRTHFQFAPCEYALSGLSAQTQYKEGANLLVKSFQLEKEITVEKEDGWISYKPQSKEPRPAWSYRVEKSEADPQAAFLTALIPYREGQTPGAVEASVSSSGDIRIFTLQVDQVSRRIELKFHESDGDEKI